VPILWPDHNFFGSRLKIRRLGFDYLLLPRLSKPVAVKGLREIADLLANLIFWLKLLPKELK
jgi:hypothetical protein